MGKKMSVTKMLGFVFLIVGIFFFLNTFSGLTGFAVFGGVGRGTSSLLGVVLVVVGLVLMKK